jgi:hypothetical protein
VTNKLYRRFVDYLQNKNKEAAAILLGERFAQSLLTAAEKIEGFIDFMGEDPNQ